MERIIPWKNFNATLIELEKRRIQYSNESAALIAEMKIHMLNGIDAYFAASKNIYDWAGSVGSSLTLYISLLSDQQNVRQITEQKTILSEMLRNGIERMNAAQDELGKSSASFNSVFGRLNELQSRFEHESGDKIADYKREIKDMRGLSYFFGSLFGIQGLIVAPKYTESNYIFQIKREMAAFTRFYDHLKLKIDDAIQNIHDTKKILRTEIQHISDLKAQTEGTESFVNLGNVSDLREIVIDSAQDLIAKCMEYRNRHIKQSLV